jgi:2-oxoglutarate ferredoxin oxidoreductase subunit beta
MFDACKLLIGAGASFVARVLAATPTEMTKVMKDAMTHPGFSFVEVISDCPEYYGRYNKLGGGAEMLTLMARRDSGVASALSEKRFINHVPSSPTPAGIDTGVFQREVRPVFAGIREVDAGGS